MDLLSLYSTLQDLRLGFRDVPPFWDRDLRELYEARLDQAKDRAWLSKRPGGRPPARLPRVL
jgi:hypothetical protein